MKKSILSVVLILFFSHFLVAQTSAKQTKGKKYFEHYNYSKTIEKYEELPDLTPEMKRDLAMSYFKTDDFEKAENAYRELAHSSERTPDDLFNFIKVLLRNEKYAEAEKELEAFERLAPNDSRAKLFKTQKGFFRTFGKDKGYYVVKNLDFNTGASEFSPVFFGDKIVFSSTRSGVRPIRRKWNWNKLPFLDLYVASLDEAKEFSSVERFSFGKRFHEGTVAFNKAGDYLVYTCNNYKQKSEDKVLTLSLFESSLENERWTKPKPLPFSTSESSCGHATLNDDGTLMFFASDAPGGVGGVDIYMSERNADGEWSEPVNLGASINTEGDEMFPFYHPDGYLFFASFQAGYRPF